MCDSSKQKTETCRIDESLISEQKRTFYFHRSPGLTFSLPRCLSLSRFITYLLNPFVLLCLFLPVLPPHFLALPVSLCIKSLSAFSVSPSIIVSFFRTLSVPPVFPCPDRFFKGLSTCRRFSVLHCLLKPSELFNLWGSVWKGSYTFVKILKF